MKRRIKKQVDYAFITIEVDDYSARSEAGINYYLHSTSDDFGHEDEPIYRFETTVHISGLCTAPKDRDRHRYDITIYGMPEDYK